jgi:hypothetical protein
VLAVSDFLLFADSLLSLLVFALPVVPLLVPMVAGFFPVAVTAVVGLGLLSRPVPEEAGPLAETRVLFPVALPGV